MAYIVPVTYLLERFSSFSYSTLIRYSRPNNPNYSLFKELEYIYIQEYKARKKISSLVFIEEFKFAVSKIEELFFDDIDFQIIVDRIFTYSKISRLNKLLCDFEKYLLCRIAHHVSSNDKKLYQIEIEQKSKKVIIKCKSNSYDLNILVDLNNKSFKIEDIYEMISENKRGKQQNSKYSKWVVQGNEQENSVTLINHTFDIIKILFNPNKEGKHYLYFNGLEKYFNII